jgi:hypothetical protein|tara:strand:+ start:1583 stop:1843 length:261 start_codon:yes stop_codon:yes gene_type:complete
MKATIEIDATPQEMRVLLGLPEVQTLQKEIMEKIRERMLDAIDTNDLDELMKLYMPTTEHLSAVEGMQKAMWDAMTQSLHIASKEK